MIQKTLKASLVHGEDMQMNKKLQSLLRKKLLSQKNQCQRGISVVNQLKKNHWRRNRYYTVCIVDLIIMNTLRLILYISVKDPLDYQGRSFLHAPQDVGVNLRSDSPPEKCFLPKAHIHTWTGHTKGIHAIRWFPKSAHLLLSASMDCRIKVSSIEYKLL